MSDNFLDSDGLVYLLDGDAPRKQGIAHRLVARALEAQSAVISYQVVQETLNVITSKLPVPLTPDQAARFYQATLAPLWTVGPTPDLYLHALDIKRRFRYDYYDSLIIAAALAAGCKTLYSEDMQHGQNIDGQLTITNPFG